MEKSIYRSFILVFYLLNKKPNEIYRELEINIREAAPSAWANIRTRELIEEDPLSV